MKTSINKQDLEKMYNSGLSISKISLQFGVHRNTISKLMGVYGIEKKYFKGIDTKTIVRGCKDLSLKELSVRYGISTTEIKRRVGDNFEKNIIYSKDRLKAIISLYDINSQGFSKQIILDDVNVYNSILLHTEGHCIQSSKITERVYRILNDFYNKDIVSCSKCGSTLKFYTMNLGYGNSNKGICENCISSHCGFSFSSQRLFWSIYNLLENTNDCYFAELNNEYSIGISPYDRTIFDNGINKYRYCLDFVYQDKVIEYDGKYWHNEEKDVMKDKFLEYKGYKVLRIVDNNYQKDPEIELKKCLEFLK